jgi:hypothetical protein
MESHSLAALVRRIVQQRSPACGSLVEIPPVVPIPPLVWHAICLFRGRVPERLELWASSWRTAQHKRLFPLGNGETRGQVTVLATTGSPPTSFALRNPILPKEMTELDAVTKEILRYATCNSGVSYKRDCQSSCPDQVCVRSSVHLYAAALGPSLSCEWTGWGIQAEKLDQPGCGSSSSLDPWFADDDWMCRRLARICH